jgi:transcription initiation factor IIE alpha subunit
METFSYRDGQNDFHTCVRRFIRLFYRPAEIVLVDFLINAEMAISLEDLSDNLGLDKQQIKSVLDTRLVRDFLVECEIVASTEADKKVGTNEYYRISPFFLGVIYHRMKKVDVAINRSDTSKSESFYCEKCAVEYDILDVLETMFTCRSCAGSLEQRNNADRQEENLRLKALYEEHVRPLIKLVDTKLVRKSKFLVIPRFERCVKFSSAMISKVQIDKEELTIDPNINLGPNERRDFVGMWLSDLTQRFNTEGFLEENGSDDISFRDRQNTQVSQALRNSVEHNNHKSSPVCASLEELKARWDIVGVWPASTE